MATTLRGIVFFDVETTQSSSGRWWLLEFGAILVCPRKLVEVGSYDTLIRPGDLSAVSRRFTDIQSAPPFIDVADNIFQILHGRVWAGHNIQRFDCPRIREAFADIGRPAPEPAGVIDSLNVLAADFGRRAGDLKMATLATYFGIGKQKHRSLDDARMNLEVLKHCATVLLLESSLPPHLLGTHHAADGAAVTRRMAAAAHRTAAPAATTAKTPTPTPKHAVVQHHRPGVLTQTKLPFTPARNQAAPAPPPPAAAAAPAPAATPTPTTPCGKRNSLGKVVPRAVVAQQPAPLSTSTGTSRRPATTPFHMILRHSRAILR